MINGKRLREQLSDDGTLLKDFGAILAFSTTVAASFTAPTVPSLVSSVLGAAGACLSASMRILARIRPETSRHEGGSTLPDTAASYERFRLLFYVACQRAFFEAISNNPKLKKLAKKRGEPPRLAIDAIASSLKEKVAQIEEAEVRFHYSIDPASRSLPLFDVYGDWLTTAFNVPGLGLSAESLAREVVADARTRLRVALSEGRPPYDWIRNFLALESEDHLAEINLALDALRTTLNGWKGEAASTLRNQGSWARYRQYLRSLPEQKESMYNEDFGVSEVFVAPEVGYHRAGLAGTPDVPDEVSNLGRLLGALLSSRSSADDLIILSGGPGSGKSTLCRMLARGLANEQEFHPIFLKLRRCKEGEEISSFLEDALVREDLVSRISDLREIHNIVVILDGFDELVLASRAKLRHFFNVLLEDLRNGPLRGCKLVVSGRDTLFPGGDGLPRGSHVISLRPFDHRRVKTWSRKWRVRHSTGPGASFYPEVLLSSEEQAQVSAVQQLVSWPLTLHLLARLHTSGLFELGAFSDAVDKAYLYRGILHETAMRQVTQAEGRGRLEPTQMRSFLREIAWAMYSRSIDSMELQDVIPVARTFFGSVGLDDLAVSELAEVAVVNAPELQKGDETGFEFVHKSFAEFLVAEKLASAVDRVCHRVIDVDGQESWQLSTSHASAECARLFGIRLLSSEVQEMLDPMLGTFSEFRRGSRVEERASLEMRRCGLTRVMERFQELFAVFVKVDSFEALAPQLSGLQGRGIFETYSHYGTAIVLVGAAASRRLSGECGVEEAPRINLEPFAGAFWRWSLLIHCGGVNVDNSLASRLYRGAMVVNVSDFSSPLRLGVQGVLAGYESGLSKAVRNYSRIVEDLVSRLIALALLMDERNLEAEKDETAFLGHDKIETSFYAGDIGHFSRHVETNFRDAEKELLDVLISGGVHSMPLPSEENGKDARRRPTPAAFSNDTLLEKRISSLLQSLCGRQPAMWTLSLIHI